MLDKYKQRVQDHIKRVQYFYGLLINNGKIPVQEINLEGIIKHDLDKLEEKNMLRQALRYKENLTVEEIKNKVLPTLDDKFAKDMGFDNVEKLEAHVKEALEHEQCVLLCQ